MSTLGGDHVDVLRAAFRDCPSVVFLTTAGGKILDATRACAAFLKVPLDVLVGRPLINFVARGDTRPFRQFVMDGARGTIAVKLRPRHAAPEAVEMSLQSVGGDRIWFVKPAAAATRQPGWVPPLPRPAEELDGGDEPVE